MRTSSAKAKGRRACAEAKALMLKYAPSLQDGDIVVTSSGETGVDLKLSPLAMTVYPLAIECKNVEKLNIWDAIKQSKGHVKGSEFPIVFFRKNNHELHVTLSAEDFLTLLKGKKDVPSN